MNKQKQYNDYHSIWRNKPPEVVQIEIDLVQTAYEVLEKYGSRHDLHPSDKLDILLGILRERGNE